MPDRVRTPNAVDVLPEDAFRALLGERFVTDEAVRRERASDWWPLAKVWRDAGDVGPHPALVMPGHAGS